MPFEFPVQLYQGLTIFLLVAIGWKGGEELAALSGGELRQALGFMVVGFITNFIIGVVAYNVLRKVDQAPANRRRHGGRLLRFRFSGHVCHLRRRPCHGGD